MSEVKTPWKDYLGDVPMHLDYFQGSMFDAVARMAELYPNNIAFDFMGKSTTYRAANCSFGFLNRIAAYSA